MFSLYNKEAILEGLLDKTLGDSDLTKHIRSRADFKELKLTENKEYKGDGPDKVIYFLHFKKLDYCDYFNVLLFRATLTLITTTLNGFAPSLHCR